MSRSLTRQASTLIRPKRSGWPPNANQRRFRRRPDFTVCSASAAHPRGSLSSAQLIQGRLHGIGRLDQSRCQKGARGRLSGRTEGGMNTKPNSICDGQGLPLHRFVTAGQVSDHFGARSLVGSLQKVDWLLGDRGYDAGWFREALKDKGMCTCIPGRKQRKTTVI